MSGLSTLSFRDNSDFETQSLRPAPSSDAHNSFAFIERIRSGIHSDHEPSDLESVPESPAGETRYDGPGETVKVSGNVCIHKIYQKEKESHLKRIIVGFSVIFSLLYTNEVLWPVALVCLLINLLQAGTNLYKLATVPGLHRDQRFELLLEVKIALCYAVYALGFLLLFLKAISCRYFVFFSFPYLLLAMFLLFLRSDDSFAFNSHRFAIVEAFQLLFIALKFTDLDFLSWSLSLIYVKLCCVYMVAFGLVLLLIVVVSLVKTSLAAVHLWKLKAVAAMLWHYLTIGATYFALTKGVIEMAGEGAADFAEGDFSIEKAGSTDTLMLASIFLIIVSLSNLIIHVLLRKEIKLFLAKVMYPQESKRQISLRFFNKNFEFGLVRVSAAYFNFDGRRPAEEGRADEEAESHCVICFDSLSNIVLKPCGHSGFCRECVIRSVVAKGKKCPICRCRICNIFVISFEKEQRQFMARGEIRVDC